VSAVPLAVVDSPFAVAGLLGVVVALLVADLLLFARGREPTFRESASWSLAWFVLGLAIVLPMLALDGGGAAVNYATVYLIERSLSLDNLFVFLLILGAFAVPQQHRSKLLFYGIALALLMRGLAILVGVDLIDRFAFVLYVLGVLLLYLAYKILRGVGEDMDPRQSAAVRLVTRLLPFGDRYAGGRFVTREGGRRQGTPLLIALVSIVAADIAFAVDSIPAAFAITTDAFVIWTANAFALLGLRALFSLVEELIVRFRYLDETIAVVLAIVAAKILLSDVVHVGPVVSLGLVLLCFAAGIAASVRGDRRDPEGARERRARRAAGAA
jgi:tellurite resistance protein TerC